MALRERDGGVSIVCRGRYHPTDSDAGPRLTAGSRDYRTHRETHGRDTAPPLQVPPSLTPHPHPYTMLDHTPDKRQPGQAATKMISNLVCAGVANSIQLMQFLHLFQITLRLVTCHQFVLLSVDGKYKLTDTGHSIFDAL